MTPGDPRPRPLLIAITDESRSFAEPFAALIEAARPGTVAVQLRHKAASGRDRLRMAQELRELTRRSGQLLLINDRLDVARMVGADGIHLPEGGVAAVEARRLLGPDALVTRAIHPHAGATLSASDVEAGLDAVVLSPLLAARKGRPALGLRELERIAAALRPIDVYALGGIDAATAASCVAAGAAGVAVLGAAHDASQAVALCHALGIAR